MVENNYQGVIMAPTEILATQHYLGIVDEFMNLDIRVELLTGSVKGKKIVIVGDILHSRVALSNIFALHMQGAEVAVCGPKTLIPKYIHELGVRVETDLRKALQWCDVANMLRIQNERLDIPYFPSTREYVQQYGLTQQILEEIGKEIIIMHPGPINRGVELTSEVADGPQSVILDQVENGVAIRMAVIYLLASQIKMQ